MLVAELKVSMNTIEVKQLLHMTRGTVGAEVLFSFGPEWKGLSKTVIFRTDMDTRDVINVQEGLPVEIPWEVLDKISDDLMVGVYGFDMSHTVTITTAWASLGEIYPSARPSDQPSQPSSPNWTEQIQNQMDRAAQAARQALDSVTAFSQEDENRTQAELQRQSAESKRCSSEKLRCAAEEQRIECSKQRQQEEYLWDIFNRDAHTAEAQRVEAETVRQNREENRLTAEFGRKEAEAHRTGDESRRCSDEKIRTEAELQRKTAEKERISSEENRSTEEVRRQLAEKRRAEAEKRRVEAENNRKSRISDTVVSTEHSWSSAFTAESFCPEIDRRASLVSCYPVENFPMEVISHISPVQEGTADPAPGNIRQIKGSTSVSMQTCRENLWTCERIPAGAEGLLYDADTQTYTVRVGTPGFCGSIYTLPAAIPAGTSLRLTVYFQQGYTQYTRPVICIGTCASGKIGAWNNKVEVPMHTSMKDQTLTHYITVSDRITDFCIGVLGEGRITTDVVFQVKLSVGEDMLPFTPFQMKKYTQNLSQEVYGGSYHWKSGCLKIEKSFFDLPPDGEWGDNIGAGTSMGLNLENYGYSDRDGAMCEDHAIETRYEDLESGKLLVLPGDGYIYMPFRTRAEVKTYLQAHPIRLLLNRKEPQEFHFPAGEYLAEPGINHFGSSTGDTTVRGREALSHAIYAIRKEMEELQNHAVGGV